ncbi:uncharacterized protein LOC129716939 [Wyeomyia smithii]|uniref:uncharacterized protein LOC129716939 n=1 Tax=Wyeomyia smithii TaxID=174621 RepID=UPI00246805F5|nr:uncharacterized protein LOC129716939 [Wyeomyia smithii]
MYGLMEAPSTPASVQFRQQGHDLQHVSCHQSRSGPDYGVLEEGFQTVPAGKYRCLTQSASADKKLPSSEFRSSDLHIYYQNVGGMNTSIEEYFLACSDESYDVIVFTETWLNDRTLSSQIFGDNYDVFRTDRCPLNSTKSIGGGVLIAVNHRFKAVLIENKSWASIEQVWIRLKLSGYSLFLCSIYIPPDRTRDATLINTHCNSINTICEQSLPNDEVVVFGDFNFSGVKWRSSPDGFLFSDPMVSSFHDGINNLLDCYSSNLLRQINHINNENGRILDLCFVSNIDCAPGINIAASPLVKTVTHHPALHLTTRTTLSDFCCTVDTVCYDFNKADYDSILNILLNINWNEELDNDNIDTAVQVFSNIMSYVIDRHVPKRVVPKSKRLPWQTSELQRLKRLKRAALRRYSKFGELSLRDEYLKVNYTYKRMSRECHSNHLRSVQSKLKSDPKGLWKYVNEQRKERELPSTMFYDERTESDFQNICDLFAQKFSSVFCNESLSLSEVSSAASNVSLYGQSLNDFDIDVSMIQSALS